jgi:hypothetical protein
MGRTALLGVLMGGAACVDTTKHGAPDGGTGPTGPQPATCQARSAVAASADAAIPTGDTAAPGPYGWKNVVIKGGGFVSGVVMSPALRGLAFARTDVGGAYRFDPAGGRWTPITDWVGRPDSNLSGIESIAVDPTDPNRVYLAAGEYLNAGNGTILSSTDMGQTWTRNALAAPMGGNADGRSMGERLAVDPNLPSTIYFGSRNAGLWISTDRAKTWNPVASFPPAGAMGYGPAFVAFDPSSGAPGGATPVLYVGVGVTTGNALYRSLDAGSTWSAVAGVPAAVAAMMPHHAAFDGCGNLYVAFNDGPGPNGVTSGFLFRYDTATGSWTDVSPPSGGGGFGGLAADPSQPGTLLVTTIDWWAPDQMYRTTDGGATWTGLGLGKRTGLDTNGADWLTFGGGSVSATGWMGDVAIDPFDPAHALYVTGQGLWSSSDVTAADRGASTSWTFADDGLEETVVLDLASPPSGPPLLSGVGDIGGFRHDDLTSRRRPACSPTRSSATPAASTSPRPTRTSSRAWGPGPPRFRARTPPTAAPAGRPSRHRAFQGPRVRSRSPPTATPSSGRRSEAAREGRRPRTRPTRGLTGKPAPDWPPAPAWPPIG